MRSLSPLKFRAKSDIPNVKGYRLILVTTSGELTNAVVARDDAGCHFVQSEDTGERLSLPAYAGWYAHKPTTR